LKTFQARIDSKERLLLLRMMEQKNQTPTGGSKERKVVNEALKRQARDAIENEHQMKCSRLFRPTI
jgi:hypothetical protein